MATRARRRAKAASGTAATGMNTRLADLRVGYRMVGDTPASRLAWVVHFARQDPAEWHSTLRAANGEALLVLAYRWTENQVALGDGTLPPALPAEDIDAVHAALRAFLTTAVVEGRVRVPRGGTEYLVRVTGAEVKPAIWGTSADEEGEDMQIVVLRRVRDLALQAGDRFMLCPVCKRPFMAVRKARFCETKCAQAERSRRHIARVKARGAR